MADKGERGRAPGGRAGGLWRLGLAAALALGATFWAQRPDGLMRLHLLDVPGDALLIETPAGRFALIDGGSDPALLALRMGRLMPIWQRGLAAALLTGGNHGRLPGQVAGLARYRAELALVPGDLPAGGHGGELRRLLAAAGTPWRELAPGQRLSLDGVRITVLAAAPGEGGGAAILVEHGATRALLHTGGELGDAGAMAAAGPPLALLAYPWQRPLDTPLIAALAPRAIAFSQAHEAGEPALLSYADRRAYSPRLYHPKNDGLVTLVSDGRRAWVETRPPP